MRKLRKRQLQKNVYGHKLTDAQLENTEETMAFYIANVLKHELIVERHEIQKQKNAKSLPRLVNQESIERSIENLEEYAADLKKMLWSFEEIAAGKPHNPRYYLIRKLLEAIEKKDMNGRDEWKKKLNDMDESLEKSYNKKLEDGIRLFAENFFSIERIFCGKVQS